MGKDTRAGRNSSHHIQLALFPRHIACMDRRGHHLFQGTLQVPLPYSLFSRGTGHHSVHTEFSGLLKSDDMEHARNLSLQHKGAVRERAALFVSVTTGNDTGRKGKGLKTQTLANRELQGKVGKRFLSDGKVRPQAVSEKIILAALRYFFPPGLAQKGNPRGRRPIKSGKHIPMGLFIQKSMIMKLQVIGKIGRHAMAIFLITGICLLTSKGIVPTGMITLLLLAGGFIGFMFRILVMIIKVFILLFIVGLLVA